MDSTEFIKVYEDLSTPKNIRLKLKALPVEFDIRARVSRLDFSYYDEAEEIDSNTIWVMDVKVSIPKKVREVVRFIADTSEPEVHLYGVMEDFIVYGDILNSDEILDDESSKLAKEFFGGMIDRTRELVKVFIERQDDEEFTNEIMYAVDAINNKREYLQ